MVGELRCMMCARHLADVVDGRNGRARLTPPAGRSASPILVERTASGLRCVRCGGRAMYEPLLGGEARPAAPRLDAAA